VSVLLPPSVILSGLAAGPSFVLLVIKAISRGIQVMINRLS